MEFVVSLAIVASVYDARSRVLPNKLLGPMALFALICQGCRWMGGAWLEWSPWLERLDVVLDSPFCCAVLACALAGCLGVAELWQRFRSHAPGLGFGDIKLVFCWVLALGGQGVWALALGSACGGVWALARREQTFALGPWVSGWAIGGLILSTLG